MTNLITKLGPYANKILLILSGVLLVTSIVLGYLYKNSLEEIGSKETLLQVSQASLDTATKKIDEQNKAIAELKLTKEQQDRLNKETTSIEVQYRDKIVYVEKEIDKDNSCENQLRLFQNILKDFSDEKLSYTP